MAAWSGGEGEEVGGQEARVKCRDSRHKKRGVARTLDPVNNV